MNDMVERAAKAIHRREQISRTEFGVDGLADWDMQLDYCKDEYRRTARAVIEALRVVPWFTRVDVDAAAMSGD